MCSTNTQTLSVVGKIPLVFFFLSLVWAVCVITEKWPSLCLFPEHLWGKEVVQVEERRCWFSFGRWTTEWFSHCGYFLLLWRALQTEQDSPSKERWFLLWLQSFDKMNETVSVSFILVIAFVHINVPKTSCLVFKIFVHVCGFSLWPSVPDW